MVLLGSVAKQHGRALRLQREFEGHCSVTFKYSERRQNPPFVQELWHNDRVRFYMIVAMLTILFSCYFSFAPSKYLPNMATTPTGEGKRKPSTTGIIVISCILWSPTIGLLINSIYSEYQLRVQITNDKSTTQQKNMQKNLETKMENSPASTIHQSTELCEARNTTSAHSIPSPTITTTNGGSEERVDQVDDQVDQVDQVDHVDQVDQVEQAVQVKQADQVKHDVINNRSAKLMRVQRDVGDDWMVQTNRGTVKWAIYTSLLTFSVFCSIFWGDYDTN